MRRTSNKAKGPTYEMRIGAQRMVWTRRRIKLTINSQDRAKASRKTGDRRQDRTSGRTRGNRHSPARTNLSRKTSNERPDRARHRTEASNNSRETAKRRRRKIRILPAVNPTRRNKASGATIQLKRRGISDRKINDPVSSGKAQMIQPERTGISHRRPKEMGRIKIAITARIPIEMTSREGEKVRRLKLTQIARPDRAVRRHRRGGLRRLC